MSQVPDDLLAHHLDTLRCGLRIMALRALGDADLAEDGVQETVARVLAAAQEGRLRSPEKLGAFAHGVARHVIADVIRERGHRRGLEALERAPGDPAITEDSPLDALVRSEAEAHVTAAMAKLSARDRELLRLSYFEGLKPAQIAEQMGEEVTRVRMRKSRALDRLRQAFLETQATRYDPPPGATKEEAGARAPPTRSGKSEGGKT